MSEPPAVAGGSLRVQTHPLSRAVLTSFRSNDAGTFHLQVAQSAIPSHNFFTPGSYIVRRNPAAARGDVKPAFAACLPEFRAGRATACDSESFRFSRPGSTA